MNGKFKIIILFKEYIEFFNQYLDNFPNRDIIKKKILTTNLEILELIYFTNLIDDRRNNQYLIISKISMLNYYLEISLKNKYISIKVFNKISNKLEIIIRLIYGWIQNGN